MPPSTRTVLLTLAGAGALALAGMNSSLRADDVWSLRTASLPLGAMLRAVAEDVHPPLYFLLLWPWVRVFGDSEWALRAPSLLLHWAAIAAVWFSARRFLARPAAWVAAIAYGCAPLALLSAELVRMYSLLGLLAALSLAAWAEAARRPGARPLILWTAIQVAGTFTHLWWFCWLGGQMAAAFVFHRRAWRRWAAACLAAVAPYAVLWGPALWRQLGGSREAAAWLLPPRWGDAAPLLYLQLGALLLALPVALAQRWRGRWDSGHTIPLWLPVMAAGALLPPLLISFWKPFFYARFTIVVLPAVVCWAAALAARGGARTMAAIVLAGAALVTAGTRLPAPGCDARAAARFLVEHVPDGGTVRYTSLSRPAIDYYLERFRPGRSWREASFPAEIDRHPGYEGEARDPARRPAWEAEAAALAREVKARPGARVFALLRNGHLPSQTLEEALKRELRAAPEPALACPDRSNYFHRIAVYEAPAAALH